MSATTAAPPRAPAGGYWIGLAGLGLFTGASLLCGLSRTQEMLVIARFAQGVGGAMTSAVILGMIVTMFREPREQAKAIGIYGFVASAGGAVGLLAGGVLTQALNWHWIFFVNVPVGVATAAAAYRLIDRDRGIGFGEGAVNYAEWGNLVSRGQGFMLQAWWGVTIPGLAILGFALGFNLLGDGLRDLLDPRLRK